MNIFQNPIAIQALSLSDFTQFLEKLSGVSLGYSDGDELILGNFINQQFIPQAKIIDNGEYL
jgi:hypothetical protein